MKYWACRISWLTVAMLRPRRLEELAHRLLARVGARALFHGARVVHRGVVLEQIRAAIGVALHEVVSRDLAERGLVQRIGMLDDDPGSHLDEDRCARQRRVDRADLRASTQEHVLELGHPPALDTAGMLAEPVRPRDQLVGHADRRARHAR